MTSSKTTFDLIIQPPPPGCLRSQASEICVYLCVCVRTQLEEVRMENGGLQERLKVLQQQVLSLEDDIDRKR